MATKTESKKAARKKQAPKAGSKPVAGKQSKDRKATAKADGGPASSKPTEPTTPAAPRDDAQPQPDDSQEIVVFAFRLTRAERDAIHAAAGSAKASKFVRGLALAAAQGDLKTVKQTMETIQKTG